MTSSSNSKMTVGKYLLARMKQAGLGHVFGVPGDFVINLCSQVTPATTGLEWVGCCNELNAGYAADGYARLNGIGCCMVTWGVGEYSAVNAIAGSFVEHVPVVIIAGSPQRKARKVGLPLHHKVGEYTLPRKIFKNITVASCFIHEAHDAAHKIDHCLSVCLRKQGPVYISVASDVVDEVIEGGSDLLAQQPLKLVKEDIDEMAIKEACEETARMLTEAKRPVIIGDFGVLRFKAAADFKSLVDESGIPFTVMPMAKGMIDETHPQFVGTYYGRRGKQQVWEFVESADCVLQLGVFPTDQNTGGFSVRLSRDVVVSASGDGSVHTKGHQFEGVPLHLFLTRLIPLIHKRPAGSLAFPKAIDIADYVASRPLTNNDADISNNKAVSVKRLFETLAKVIPANSVVVSDAAVPFYSSLEMVLPPGVTFISQAYYVSIGFSLPASLGVALATASSAATGSVDGDNGRKVVLLVGDGSSQMTIQEMSTMIRQHANVSVILLNNDGYTIERLIMDGDFNDVGKWHYHKLPQAFGATEPGVLIQTEQQLHEAVVSGSLIKPRGFSFAEVVLPRMDVPGALQQAAIEMRK